MRVKTSTHWGAKSSDNRSTVQVLDERLCSELKDAFDAGALDALLTTFLTRLDDRYARINVYLQSKDREALLQEAHSLKGAASSLGCVAIAELASQLEISALEAPLSDLALHLERLAELRATTQQALQQESMLCC